MTTANRNHRRSEVSLERDRTARTPLGRHGRAHGAFKIAQHTVGQRTVLLVRGDLDSIHAPALGQAVNRALATRPQELVIDLCDVDVIDYRGLSVLLNARRRARQLGAGLSLACDVPTTLRLLERMRLRRAFDIHPADGPSRRKDTRALPKQAEQ